MLKPSRAGWMAATDERILEDLRETRLDYAALIASRCGIHLPHAEDRCRELARYGLIEPASREVVYRITERGERYLDGDLHEDDLERDDR